MNAIELSNRARRLAKAKGLHDEADDFAQDAYISLAGGRKAQLRTLLIDFMRDTFGDSRYPDTMKNNLEYHSVIPDTEVAPSIAEPGIEWSFLLGLLKPKDRLPIVLKYQWGLSQSEIAFALGVTEGRVTQRIQEISEYLKKKLREKK